MTLQNSRNWRWRTDFTSPTNVNLLSTLTLPAPARDAIGGSSVSWRHLLKPRVPSTFLGCGKSFQTQRSLKAHDELVCSRLSAMGLAPVAHATMTQHGHGSILLPPLHRHSSHASSCSLADSGRAIPSEKNSSCTSGTCRSAVIAAEAMRF